MTISIPDRCEELKPYVGRSERTDLGIIRKEAFQRFGIAADNLNPIFFEPEAAKAAGYSDVVAPPLFLKRVAKRQSQRFARPPTPSRPHKGGPQTGERFHQSAEFQRRPGAPVFVAQEIRVLGCAA